MAEFGTYPPIIDDIDWNQLLDHGLEKPASWVVRQDGSTYEAVKGGTTSAAGTVVYSGANAATVINSCIGAIRDSGKNGGLIHLKAGSFDCGSTKITSGGEGVFNPSIILEGEGASHTSLVDATQLRYAGTDACIEMRSIGGTGRFGSQVRDLGVEAYGNATTAANAAGVKFVDTKSGEISNVHVQDFDGTGASGICLTTRPLKNAYSTANIIRNPMTYNCYCGIRLTHGGTGNAADLNTGWRAELVTIIGGYLGAHTKGVWLEHADFVTILGTLCAYCTTAFEIHAQAGYASTEKCCLVAPQAEQCTTGIYIDSTLVRAITIIAPQFKYVTTFFNFAGGGNFQEGGLFFDCIGLQDAAAPANIKYAWLSGNSWVYSNSPRTNTPSY